MSAPEPPADLSYSYAPRLGGAGVRLRLVPGALEWAVGLAEGRLPLADIASVELRYLPAKFAAPSFEMEIRGRDGIKLKAGSASRVSLTGVKDQKAEYAAFVRALHRALAGAGCRPRLSGGYAPWRFWVMAVLGLIVLGGFLALFGAAVVQQQWSYALFLGAMGAFLAWPTGDMIWRNRPLSYAPDALPRHLLPA